mgnify:CR=1 FL=1|jgi:sialic acid synthase SpsE|tara:strand:+ start:4815 stop:5810 length:996 start_codon:yes stop_codon:yes gene_type:complete
MFSKKKYPYLIAEVGNSHEGSFNLCKKSIKEAKIAGADCVKFQLFDYKTIVNPRLKIIKHAKSKHKFQSDRFKSIQLDIKKVKILSNIAKKIGIDFSVSVFDPILVKPVAKYISFFKIASGDITYVDLLKEIKKTGKKVVLSTGMSSVKEIKDAVRILGKNKCEILHCISKYPTENNELNLNSITYLKRLFKKDIGFSDHSKGIDACVVASALGSKVIEKHFIPSGAKKIAADKALSINYEDFLLMKNRIQETIDMLGLKTKKLFSYEKYYLKNLRRSVYFSKPIKKGSLIKKKDLIIVRPHNYSGLSISQINKIVGKKAKRNFKKFSLVK